MIINNLGTIIVQKKYTNWQILGGFGGGSKNTPKMLFSRTHTKMRCYAIFADSQKPANLYSTKGRFLAPLTPVSGGHSDGYAAAQFLSRAHTVLCAIFSVTRKFLEKLIVLAFQRTSPQISCEIP